MLRPFKDLPEGFKNAEVLKYYKKLERRQASILLKRIFDLLFAVILTVILSPVMLVIAVMIKADSKGPVFYKQSRVTTYGKVYRIFKFRTMISNADKCGPLVTGNKDARITKIGSRLRDLRLDEIPQLFNVITGDMSFVGTRPEVEAYVAHYTDEMMATLLLPAGITSPTSIRFKDESKLMDKYRKTGKSPDDIYIHLILPKKMEINLKYLKDFSVFGDFKIMLETVMAVLR